ncbi:MAG TPA: signal peptide peptidase SppA [Patescibacteria group bacterium]|nr:signal peptide peptidase SppA [Patescibacteria group bacterium]
MFKKMVVMIIGAIILVSLGIVIMVGPGMKQKNLTSTDKKIAVIYVEGVILGGRGSSGLLGDGGGTDAIIKQLHMARDDESVRAVVLRINSPGGSAPASQEVGEEVQKLRASGKKVITSMGDIAASGGYWIAACSEKIYANPATLTGSIGVYIPYTNWEELFNKLGVHQEKIKSGPHKDILSPDRAMTPEERALIQEMVDDLYQQFVTVVAEGRTMDEETVRALADGRVYTGRQARDLGLVDEFGNLYDAIDGAAKMVGITGKPEVVEYGRNSPWTWLFGANDKTNLEQLLARPLRDSPLLLLAPSASMPR